MNAEQILFSLRSPTVVMTREQISEAWDALKARHKNLQVMAATQFRAGDKVEFEGRRGRTQRGTVTKVNQKTVTVEVMQKTLVAGNFVERPTLWRVAASLLKKV